MKKASRIKITTCNIPENSWMAKRSNLQKSSMPSSLLVLTLLPAGCGYNRHARLRFCVEFEQLTKKAIHTLIVEVRDPKTMNRSYYDHPKERGNEWEKSHSEKYMQKGTWNLKWNSSLKMKRRKIQSREQRKASCWRR